MTAVSLAPAAGKTEIVVAVSGAVDVRGLPAHARPTGWCSTWSAPRWARTTASLYDGVKRGGVLNLRYSQFRPDVVRIVVDLDGPQTYKVDRAGDAIRVSFDSGEGFQAWSSTDRRQRRAGGRRGRLGRRGGAGSPSRPARKPEVGLRSAAHADPRRRAPHHRHLGPRQHRRRGRRLRRLQRPHHHPRQGHEG